MTCKISLWRKYKLKKSPVKTYLNLMKSMMLSAMAMMLLMRIKVMKAWSMRWNVILGVVNLLVMSIFQPQKMMLTIVVKNMRKLLMAIVIAIQLWMRFNLLKIIAPNAIWTIACWHFKIWVAIWTITQTRTTIILKTYGSVQFVKVLGEETSTMHGLTGELN